MEGSGRRDAGTRRARPEHRASMPSSSSVSETRDQARSVKDKLSDRIAERKLRRSEDDE